MRAEWVNAWSYTGVELSLPSTEGPRQLIVISALSALRVPEVVFRRKVREGLKKDPTGFGASTKVLQKDETSPTQLDLFGPTFFVVHLRPPKNDK